MAEALAPGYPTTPPPGYPTAPPPPPESGLSLGRVGQIAGEELGKVPGRMLEDVKGMLQTIQSPKMADVLPLSLGPASGLAGGVARAATTGLGRGLDKPGDIGAKAWEGIKATGVAGLWEGILGSIPFARSHRLGIPSISETAGARRTQFAETQAAQDQYKAAADAVEKAYNAIRGHVDPGKVMFVPQIDPKNPISFRQAADGLKNLEGLDWQIAREQIGKELNRIDRFRAGNPAINFRGPGASARQQFRGITPKDRVAPGPTPANQAGDRAIAAEQALSDPALRAATDILATTKPEMLGGNLQTGALLPLALGKGAGSLWDLASQLVRHR